MSRSCSFVGRKRRFIAYGLLNIVIANGMLQFLLAFNVATGFATMISQLFNVSFGYLIYGTQVFRVERLAQRNAFLYGGLALLLWWANWAGINFLAQFGWSRRLAALTLIPLLAACSYLAQKHVVFPQSNQP